MNRVARRQGHFEPARPQTRAAVLVALLMVLAGVLSFSSGVGLVGAAGVPHSSSTTSVPGAGGSPSVPSGIHPGAPAAASPGRATPANPLFSHVDASSFGPFAPIHPDTVTPALTVGPTSGTVGKTITFNATGYAHNSAFNVSYLNPKAKPTAACLGLTSSTGTFSCTFVVPPLGAGVHAFTGTDAKGHAAPPAAFTVKPKLVLTPASGLVGTLVTIQGLGFAGGIKQGKPLPYTVSVNWSKGVVCSNVATSGVGGFNCSLTMPPVPSGPHPFYGVDNASHSANAPFTIVSGLSVGPSYGMAGSTVTFTGTGFHASSNINISWSQGTACASTKTLGTGGFTCAYTLPAVTPGGEYNFTARDNSSAKHPTVDSAVVSYFVTFLRVLPQTAIVGSTVHLVAGGFAPGRTMTVDFGPVQACGGSLSSPFGAYQCNYTIPPAVAGVHTFTASNTLGASHYGANASFVVESNLTATPGFGPAGSSVTFSGTGFAGASAVSVYWLGGVFCSATTGSSGSFSCTASLPGNASGASYAFTAVDAASNFAIATFVVTYLQLTPSSGPVGTSLGVNGAGYPSSAAFNVQWGAATVCSGTTSRTGTFSESSCSGRFSVPEVPAGTYVLDANLSTTTYASASFVVTSALSMPSHALVDSNLTISGTGFGASAAVTVSWAGGVACALTANVLGAFSCVYVIPPIVWGSYLFTAADNESHAATATLTITPLLTISPTSGPPGTVLTIDAFGYSPSSAISIVWTDGVACAGTTNSAGSFACSYLVPPIPGSSKKVVGYTFIATDASSHNATATFKVVAILFESPWVGPPGTVVTVSGIGYPASTLIKVNWTGISSPVCTASTSGTGVFSCSFAVPSVPSGNYTIVAVAGPTKPQLTFHVSASLTVTPTRGPVGTPVTLVGAGFAPLQPATVTLGGSPACSVTTLATGSFSCAFRIPTIPYGTHSFIAGDAHGNSASATFTVQPQLSITPSSGPVGSHVTFNGSGFPANAGITVSWTLGAVCSATATGLGSFSCTVTIPPATVGPHEFTAKNDSSSSASANFTVTPELQAIPSTGLTGTHVTFVGTGYGDTVAVTIAWVGGTVCTNTTTSVGGFSCTYTIPSGTPGGAYAFTGADGVNDSAVATFTVLTSLVATPNHGPVGTSVTFTGSGYGNAKTVTVTWSGGVACSAVSSGTGTFTCSFPIPGGTAGGAYTFTSRDTLGNTASAEFVVTFLTAAPTGGVAGTAVVFNAGGFNPSSAISITWSGGTACTGTTTTTGTFRCGYTIPGLTTPGPYTFTASDGGSEHATTQFTVFGVPSLTVPAPSRAAADVGQGVTFTTVPSGGSGVYSTFSWTESSGLLGCALVNAAAVSCSPTAPGNFTVSVTVTDSDGVASSVMVSATFTVSPALGITTPTLNVTSSDVGQSVTFSTTSSGGSGGLSFLWSNLPVGCAGSGPIVVCSPTAPVAGALVSVKVTDSNFASATSGTLSVTVYADPSATTPTANRAGADLGQPVTFSTTTSGGHGTLTVLWSGLPTGCSGSSATVHCSPDAPAGAFSIRVAVTDQNGFRFTSAALSFTVSTDPALTNPQPSRASADMGQSVWFNISSGGGAGALTYVWSGLPTGCSGSTTSVHCTPSAPGSFLVSVTVTDTNDFNVSSAAVPYDVYADPVASAPTAAPPGVDLGQPVSFQSNVAGGAPGATFVWVGLPTGCAGTSGTIVCSVTNASAVGHYTIHYTVTDGNGFASTSGSISFQVDADPTVSTPTATQPSGDVGQTVTFSTVAGGGAGGLSFAWTGLPDGCGGSTAVVVCDLTVPVDLTDVNVTVTDLNGFSVTSASLPFTVYADPQVGLPTATPGSADVGQSVTFNTSVLNGSGGYTFTWTGLPAGCAGTTIAIVCASVSGAATYSVQVTVKDSNGISRTSGTFEFTVYADPTVTTPVPSRGSVDVGQTVTFTATGGGGSGGLTYAWSGLPSGCTGTTTDSVTCVPTAALASTSVRVTVTDSNGFATPSGAASFTVFASLTVTLSASSGSILKGHSVTFTATVTGGSGGLSYAWTGLPAGCTGMSTSSITCSPSASGSYTVGVTATDSNGGAAQSSVSLGVTPTFLGLPAGEGYAVLAGLILAVLAVGVVLAVLLLRRRRLRGPSAPLPWEPQPPMGSAPFEPVVPVAPPPPVAPPEPSAPPTPPEEPSPWEMPPNESNGGDGSDEAPPTA